MGAALVRPDILGLREFYASPLGRRVRARLARLALARWTQTGGDVILGLGYATPVIRFFLRQSGKDAVILAVMPRSQGAVYWPTHGDNRTVMAHKQALPLAPNSVHRAVLLHALEFAEDPLASLRELYQAMTPGGRALLCVPNRRSVWSGASSTPFGYGTPYSVAQLRQISEKAGFTCLRTDTELFFLPLHHPLLQKLARPLELIRWILPRAGGLLVLEVEKQIYASLGERAKDKAIRTVWVPAAG